MILSIFQLICYRLFRHLIYLVGENSYHFLYDVQDFGLQLIQ